MFRYLSLAAILAAGTSGVAHNATLAIEDLKTGSAATLSDAERSALGIRHRLSQSWTEARSALQKDEELTEMLGKEVVKDYLNVNGVSRSVVVPSAVRRADQILW